MKVFEINGTMRGTGKSQTKKVRNAGDVPCVLYGSGDPVHFAVKKIEIKKAVYTPDVFIVNLNLDGKMHKAIIRDSQFHRCTMKSRIWIFCGLKKKVWLRPACL